MLLCVLLLLSCFDLIEENLGDLFDSYSVEFESGDEYGTRRGLSVVCVWFVGWRGRIRMNGGGEKRGVLT